LAYPSSVFLRLAPGPGPRPPVLCGALSASPRRKCWNLMRFRHLSLSCTPVRPLRRRGEEEGKKGEGKRSVGGLDVLERARWSAGGNSAGRPRAGAGERRGIATRVHGRRRAGRSVDEARPYARARVHPPSAPPRTIHRLQRDRHPFEPWIDESAAGKRPITPGSIIQAPRRLRCATWRIAGTG